MSVKDAISKERSKYGGSTSSARKTRESKKFPHHAEPSMTHPLNRSTIKLRDNGVVDIFTGTDNGIRVDPNSKSINMIGNQHRELVNISNRRVYKYSQENVNGNWTVNSYGGNINLTAEKGNINVKAAKDIYVESAESGVIKAKKLDFTGDEINIKSKDLKINSSKVSVDSSTFDINSSNKVNIKSSNIETSASNVKTNASSVKTDAMYINLNGDTKVNGVTVPHHDH